MEIDPSEVRALAEKCERLAVEGLLDDDSQHHAAATGPIPISSAVAAVAGWSLWRETFDY